MSSDDFRTVLPTLMRELVEGAPDERTPTYMLNRGDVGLLAVLDRLSAASASAQPTGGASIAAQERMAERCLLALRPYLPA